MLKQVRYIPISTALYQRWQERGHKTEGWPEIVWYVETCLRRKLGAARKAHGPTALDIVYGRKTRKAEDKDLDLLVGHLSTDQPTSVNRLHVATNWHHSTVTKRLTRLATMKRAKLTDGGWLALEATAKLPSENGRTAESSSATSGAVPENAKRVQVKFKGVGWVGAEVAWNHPDGPHVEISCDQCRGSSVFIMSDRMRAMCDDCDAAMPLRTGWSANGL